MTRRNVNEQKIKYLNTFSPRVSFESVDKILWCDDTNDTYLA